VLFVLQLLLDSKGGSWQLSGGQLQPPWLFRRKASPTWGAKKETSFVYQDKRGFSYAYTAHGSRRSCRRHLLRSVESS